MRERVSSKCPDCEKQFYGKFCRCGYEGRADNHKPFAPRCFVIGCNSKADERRGENEWMCCYHSEEYILKTQPYSLDADCIRLSRKFEKEAKDAGMTNAEYFSFKNPAGYAASQSRMKKAGDMAKKVVDVGQEEKIKDLVNY